MTKNKKGFTIIEVVLVLAIAGLIFLMVFIALPALQRSQRNTQRKDDMARIMTAVTDFMSNNSGYDPWAAGKQDDFVSKYVKANGGAGQFQDPDGTSYKFEDKGIITATVDNAVEYNDLSDRVAFALAGESIP